MLLLPENSLDLHRSTTKLLTHDSKPRVRPSLSLFQEILYDPVNANCWIGHSVFTHDIRVLRPRRKSPTKELRESKKHRTLKKQKFKKTEGSAHAPTSQTPGLHQKSQ